jgi:hypothetical protein
MDRRSIILYLHLTALSAHAFHDDHVTTLDPQAVAHGTVAWYLREAKLGTAEVALDPESSSPHLDDSDWAILAALEQKRFSSR